MFLKILNAALILFALYMGIKQGWAMFSGKQEMLDMFGKWHMGRTSVAALGAFTMLGALLVLFPRTFLAGNFITAAGILLIIALHLNDTGVPAGERLKGVAIELPFFLLSLLIIYLQHPLAKTG